MEGFIEEISSGFLERLKGRRKKVKFCYFSFFFTFLLLRYSNHPELISDRISWVDFMAQLFSYWRSPDRQGVYGVEHVEIPAGNGKAFRLQIINLDARWELQHVYSFIIIIIFISYFNIFCLSLSIQIQQGSLVFRSICRRHTRRSAMAMARVCFEKLDGSCQSNRQQHPSLSGASVSIKGSLIVCLSLFISECWQSDGLYFRVPANDCLISS